MKYYLVLLKFDWKNNGIFLKPRFFTSPSSIDDLCRSMIIVKALLYASSMGFQDSFGQTVSLTSPDDSKSTSTQLFLVKSKNETYRDFDVDQIIDGLSGRQITTSSVNRFLNKHKELIFDIMPSPNAVVPRCQSQGLLSSIFKL